MQAGGIPLKNYDSHLYQILSPNPALVASQLSPELFAKHYTSGSTRYYAGKVVFAEIDLEYRHPFLNIDEGLEAMIPHEDGSPKATRFISSYRVLEHIDFDAILKLYLATPQGFTFGLESAPYEKRHQKGYLRIFAEITPLRMLVLSNTNFAEFGKQITAPNYSKGAPKLFYTQINLDIDDFLKDFEERPTMHPPIPGLHPAILRDAILGMRFQPEKPRKGLSLASTFDNISYRSIRHGFMFASQQGTKFFPMPSEEKVMQMNPRFWRNM
jgi:hypothetical protein